MVHLAGVRRRERRRAEHGFSLLEVLAATLLLSLIALGIIPLFTRSISNNAVGREATDQSNFGRSQAEELMQLPFNHLDLEVDAGTQRLTDRNFIARPLRLGSGEWRNTTPSSGEVHYWTRRTVVRQYSINGVRDNDGDDIIDEVLGLEDTDGDGLFDAPLDAGTIPAFIHLKEIDIILQSERGDGGPIADRPPLRLRSLKSF
jgi:prepilin-type N-terminal cleavage/methylation domain-containing protein